MIAIFTIFTLEAIKNISAICTDASDFFFAALHMWMAAPPRIPAFI